METSRPQIDSPASATPVSWKWRIQFLFANHEHDPRFRTEIVALAIRGLRLGCLLGLLLLFFYTGAKIWIDKKPLALVQGPDGNVSVADKLVILLTLTTLYALSFKPVAERRSRLMIGIGVVVMSLALAIDDFTNLTAATSIPWLVILLICVVGVIPMRALQTLVLGVCVALIYPLLSVATEWLLHMEAIEVVTLQRIFMWVIVIAATVISGNLYQYRYLAYSRREDLALATGRITEQARRLEELDHVKARFFANLSHEFRTPLTLMLGPVEDALRGYSGPLTDRLKRDLDVARRNGGRLKTLIDELLDLSRLEAGRMELREGMHDMVFHVRSIVGSFSSLAETRKVQLGVRSEVDSLVMAFDADKMERIISNLLSNAIKFTPANGKVYVSLDLPGDERIRIQVRDTGPGIPVAELEHVFDRFYKVGSMESDVQAGTGIGLALVRELTELHGGTISVDSQEGFGSTFTLDLPERSIEDGEGDAGQVGSSDKKEEPEESQFDETIEDDEVRPPEDAPLILVAEDNDDVRTYLRGHLERRYRVAEACDGEEALEQLRKEQPALILSDVMMPGMDGHALCRSIKENPKTNHIPVVLVTARASEDSRREGLEYGADDYLFKPFNAANLMLRVENLIEIRRVLRERFSAEYVVKPSEKTVKSADAQLLDRLQEIAEEHLGDSNFGVDWLASEIGLSPRQLQRRIRAAIGLTASGFIRTLRLERAAQLLKGHAGTVSEISYQVGFQDANYFSRIFRQTFGVPPTEYEAQADSS